MPAAIAVLLPIAAVAQEARLSLKDAERLNAIGEAAGEEYGVRFLPSDFKKKNGYKRSTELSAEYHLYRQNYCGCVFSIRRPAEDDQDDT